MRVNSGIYNCSITNQNKYNQNFGAFKTNSSKIIKAIQDRGVKFYYIKDGLIMEPQPEMSLKGIVFLTRNDLNYARLSSWGEGSTPPKTPIIAGKQKVRSWQNYMALARREARFIKEKEELENIKNKPFENLISFLDLDWATSLRLMNQK